MTLGEKFTDGAAFLAYVEETFGVAFIDTKVKDFYTNNKSMRFTYTGILKALKAL